MNTLVFFASPNTKGNTYTLMKRFLEGIDGKIDIIEVYEKKISPCVDCKFCYSKEQCSIKDDMIDVYNKISNSDLIVVATPMYFSSVPAPMKALIDRLQVYWSKKYIRNDRNFIKIKKGIILGTSGISWNNMFNPLESVLNQAFAAMDAKKIEKIYAVDTDEIPVEKNHKVLQDAYKLAIKISQEFKKNNL
ncbi:flavodoxin family protein [Clostridium rectalis]|uniref:flavodoxin family protein n=1 Tax=Clostridium rectalis TaxID=2040295 RepID=UPI000F62C8E4|nr:flavodoxin family protein [Clostridium rectalis]